MKNFNDFVVKKVVDVLVQENWEVQVNQTSSISRNPWTATEEFPICPRDHDEERVCFKVFKPKNIYFPICVTFIGLDIGWDAEWRDVCISYENTLLGEEDYPEVVYMVSMTPVLIKKIQFQFRRWAEIIRSEMDNAKFRQRMSGEGLRKWREEIAERLKERTSPYVAGASAKQDRLEVECYLAYHVFME